ncbi:MAG: DNA polymerase III subunit gamma/tau [Eubacteriaceae bacterium]|jgi:DNA polymerase-3 subunit gamma/tau
MSYLALYRKYRPVRFEDVAGQDTTVRILKNQIMTGRIGHAYLFSGIRGTGKTTLAKIFARAVSCENPHDGSPCGSCGTCLALSKAGTMDIIEIDAASNRGVDEIRDLREKVKYPPAVGKYKVYIIDEVHMLTKEAFNALLKTLEEPPEHAIFLLATTEPARLPATIQSRCQHFEIRPIGNTVIEQRMREICSLENIVFDDEAYQVLAERAHHSMRDGLSLLDQASDLELPGVMISGSEVRELLGTAREDSLFGITEAQRTGDIKQLLELLSGLRSAGISESLLLEDLICHYRDLILIRCGGNGSEKDREQAAGFEMAGLYRAVDVLVEAHSKMRFNTLSEVITDTALLRLCTGEELPVPAAATVGRTTDNTSRQTIQKPVKNVQSAYQEPSVTVQPENRAEDQRPAAQKQSTVQKQAPVQRAPKAVEQVNPKQDYPEPPGSPGFTKTETRNPGNSGIPTGNPEPSKTQHGESVSDENRHSIHMGSRELKAKAMGKLTGLARGVLEDGELQYQNRNFYLIIPEETRDPKSQMVVRKRGDIQKVLQEITGRKAGLKIVGKSEFRQMMQKGQAEQSGSKTEKVQKTVQAASRQKSPAEKKVRKTAEARPEPVQQAAGNAEELAVESIPETTAAVNNSAAPDPAAPGLTENQGGNNHPGSTENNAAPNAASANMEEMFRAIVPDGDYTWKRE